MRQQRSDINIIRNNMQIFSTFVTAYTALSANIGRSLLTILGIIIGVLSIVLVMALGEGAQNLILNEVQGIGATAVIVRPGKQPDSPTNAAETLLSDSLKERDIIALRRKENVPDAVSVDPAIFVPGSVSYLDEVYRPTIFGWTPGALQETFSIFPDQGDMFTDDDVRQRAKVVVIGSKVKEELFGESDALGEFITIKGQKLRIIGILPPHGQASFFNIDELVVMPYTTAQKTIMGIDFYHEVFVRAANDKLVDDVAADIEATIRENHNITDPEKDDFFVETQQNAVETISTITQVLTVFLAAIASIALVVGGVGIMNIMLVSVTERTHEIGLRMAVGATRKDIMQQFLIEAIMLTMSGGLIGTVSAIALSALITWVIRTQFNLNWPFSVPIPAIVLGVSVATAIGFIFGIYPARKAAKKDPIEALRYE